ncbi:MAG: LLM class flavin-dependent oxidoreductase, partial [Solirubrobacterales bacterium]|nr:LLM class flavin-dependent oxidoreductase [Solirubrobacterales bacterium]
PRPIQPELPIWITAAGSPDTFRMAGEQGFGVLTHLLGQSVAELGDKIAIYRQAVESRHQGKWPGDVVLMLHTFVGADNDHVRELVREPMKAYLRSSVDLIRRAAWSFPTFKQATMNADGDFSLDHLTEKELDEVLDFSFERYFETSGLLGTPQKCLELVDQLREIQVDEVACLIDFHSDTDAVLAHLPNLEEVRSRSASGTYSSDEESIPSLIERYGVTHLQCTPSLASMLVQSPAGRRALRSLRRLLVGGEAFPPALAAELIDLVAGEVINMYGPTETTIWSSTFRVDRADQAIPIGRPIANTQLYILDNSRHPVAPGTPGELYIAGDGVTLGYFGRPDLTADRFPPDPFAGRPGARMYRTGDLARHREDGNVEFLGRADHQVKIRGYRIELGEIEAALGRHPEVGETVVVAAGDGELSDKRLVAYLTGRNGTMPSADSLRDHLKTKVPEFMIPSSFEVLPTLPRTPNGKVDRAALPLPGSSQAIRATEPSSARDDVERALIEIWEDALGVAPIGIHDNFFDLGGHSLLAMRVFGDLKRTLDIDLPLPAFLRAATIEQLSTVIAQHNPTEVIPSHWEGETIVRHDDPGTIVQRERPEGIAQHSTANGNGHAQSQLAGTRHSAISIPYESESGWRGARNRILQELAQVVPGAQTSRVRLHRARGVNIGENVWIGYGAVLETAHPELITIEDDASISIRVTIIAHFMETMGVKIERGAFLGPGVIVLPSVVIGHGAVVTAGSVVSQSIPPMTVAQGNPAVPIATVGTTLRPNEMTLEEFSRDLKRI